MINIIFRLNETLGVEPAWRELEQVSSDRLAVFEAAHREIPNCVPARELRLCTGANKLETLISNI